ncbi:MAG: pyridoxal-phosphate dependent enzyme [Lachnospiraceae bacterium]|nr:pyridoxal-phosphate dependent enzyme [Lachnospiraceae bacterium]
MSNIYFLEKYKDANIYIKREDLHPFSFGGNKVKIAQEIFADMEERGFNSVISFGSPTSNMNRAIAHMAAAKGIPCRVILKVEEECGHSGMSMNERLVRESGAQITECSPANVRETVERVMAEAKAAGEKPYYIYGDSTGHGNEEVLMRAYGKQSWPIREFEREQGIRFHDVFLPVGTAATISGLMASVSEGCEVDEPQMRLHGISIARNKEAVEEAIRRFLGSCGYDTPTCLGLTDITDAYLEGGYGRTVSADNAENTEGNAAGAKSKSPVHQLIEEKMRTLGLPLDPVYTGKAYYGMLREIDRLSLTGDILFIHTGGTPLFFDYWRSR